MRAKVAAILLAAGASRRMGRCKQLLPLAGKRVIDHCLATLLAGGVDEVVVVVSPDGDQVARAAREYPARVVRNPATNGDMATSVRTGRSAISPHATGVVVALCDYPLVTAATIARLVEAHRLNPEAIVIPAHHGRRGYPPLFPRLLLDDLAVGMTLRDLPRDNPERIELLPVSDEGVLIDMDTPDDYRRIIERNRVEAICESS